MHKLLQELAELVGREWARRWLENLRRSQNQHTSPHERFVEDQADDVRRAKPREKEGVDPILIPIANPS